ncbi:S-layer homology domain-containing protein [Acetonema longum]|uniref:S-layer domain protein n=1 Tax=Acetonema longum DSM 6540 TaxID=1009370 RepID=F7NLZ0_9FIRM|nr:S-layer homology domain-containing protein [Acetonema longum]EGO62916.1 S-layer domain protein [Acetonema longum DSM 6540]
MKKGFIAALVAVTLLGLAGTVFANPYSDVPPGHWAYDAVNELAKAGIMGDSSGKFNGNQTLTRYEMATIVARVMARSGKADNSSKALVDKLAVEFSAELDSLGLRVTKLEQAGFGSSAASVSLSGDYRMRWSDEDVGGDTAMSHRVRLAVNAEVNENTDAYIRIMGFNHTNLGQWQTEQGSDMDITDANVTVKGFIGTDFTFGRFSHKLGIIGAYLDSTGGFDGVKTVIGGGNAKLTAAFADANLFTYDSTTTPGNYRGGSSAEVATVQADLVLTKQLSMAVYYLDWASAGVGIVDPLVGNPAETVTGYAAQYAFNPNWNIAAEYQTQKKGSLITAGRDADDLSVKLSYKGAKANRPGSWGFYAEYFDWEGAALDSYSVLNPSGREALGLGAEVALARNITLEASYYDIKKDKGVSTPTPAGDPNTFAMAQVNVFF